MVILWVKNQKWNHVLVSEGVQTNMELWQTVSFPCNALLQRTQISKRLQICNSEQGSRFKHNHPRIYYCRVPYSVVLLLLLPQFSFFCFHKVNEDSIKSDRELHRYVRHSFDPEQVASSLEFHRKETILIELAE